MLTRCQGSMKELPPLPLHVPDKRVSSASAGCAASLLPRLDLGSTSLDISQELLSPDADLDEAFGLHINAELGKSTNSRRSRMSDPSHGLHRAGHAEERSVRREARRATALWVAMLGSLDGLGFSTIEQDRSLKHGQSKSPLLSPTASSDCLDPFFPPLPAASSSTMAHWKAPNPFDAAANLHKPLPPSPRLRSPSAPTPYDSGRFQGESGRLPSVVKRVPRRASLPVQPSNHNSASSASSKSKKRPPLSNLLTPILDVEEGPSSAPLAYPSQRSLSLPGETSEGSLPTLSSTQTVTPAGYRSQHRPHRYRFPSAASADSDYGDRTPVTSAFPTSYEMREREHSFSSSGSAFFSSDGERSRRSSNFTADSSIPSPRSPGFEEGPDAATPKLASESFPLGDQARKPRHLRIDSTASRQPGSAGGGLKRSPTMEIVMYGMAM